MIEPAELIDFALATIRTATPLIFAAIGVLLAERAGVLHIGVEGSMLLGSFVAVFGSLIFGDPWAGVLLTVLSGVFVGWVLALLTVTLPTDQVVIGIAFNIGAVGVTSFLFRITADLTQRMTPPLVSLFPESFRVLPVVGGLTAISPLAWVAAGLAAATWYFLYRTGPGLLFRCAGESSHAAKAAGIDVVRVRFAALTLAAVLSALGGAALTVGWVRSFSDNITLGRGFIALAAVYFGRWNPAWAAMACVLFGAGDALAFQAQGSGANPHYYLMLPYLLTLVVVGFAGRARAPQDVGKVFTRG